MTKHECAAAITGRAINELDFLDNEFLEDMRISALSLCYMYDEDNFKVVGAAETVIKFYVDHPEEVNLMAFRDVYTRKIRFDWLDHQVLFANGKLGRPVVRFPIILNRVAKPDGYSFTLEAPISSAPVIVHSDKLICQGFVFSDSDII